MEKNAANNQGTNTIVNWRTKSWNTTYFCCFRKPHWQKRKMRNPQFWVYRTEKSEVILVSGSPVLGVTEPGKHCIYVPIRRWFAGLSSYFISLALLAKRQLPSLNSFHKSPTFYEATWLCNSTFVQSDLMKHWFNGSNLDDAWNLGVKSTLPQPGKTSKWKGISGIRFCFSYKKRVSLKLSYYPPVLLTHRHKQGHSLPALGQSHRSGGGHGNRWSCSWAEWRPCLACLGRKSCRRVQVASLA